MGAIESLMELLDCDRLTAERAVSIVRSETGKRGGRPRKATGPQLSLATPQVTETTFKAGFPLVSDLSDRSISEIGKPGFLESGFQAPPALSTLGLDGAVRCFAGWWRTKWQTQLGAQWVPEPGILRTVRSTLSALAEVDDCDEEFRRLPAAMDRYFVGANDYIRRARFPLRLFLSNLNTYRVQEAPVHSPAPVKTQSIYQDLGALAASKKAGG